MPLEKLCNMKAFYERDPEKINSHYQLIQHRDIIRFINLLYILKNNVIRANPPLGLDQGQLQFIEAQFSLAIVLFQVFLL